MLSVQFTANAARCRGDQLLPLQPACGSYISQHCSPTYAFSPARSCANSLPARVEQPSLAWPNAAFTRRLDSSALQRFQRRHLITAVSCGDA